MQDKEKMMEVANRLKQRYPVAECALHYDGEAWKLLIMGALSAQCTDAKVNAVCQILFSKYPTPQSIADADVLNIEKIIKPCGLYHHKAQNMIAQCRLLIQKFGGVLPDSMEALLEFDGVGRKVANLLLGDIYHKGGFVTDTHCMRICERLGFYGQGLTPYQIEKALDPLLPKNEQSDFCHRVVWFGREVCSSRNPDCAHCPLTDLCDAVKNSKNH